MAKKSQIFSIFFSFHILEKKEMEKKIMNGWTSEMKNMDPTKCQSCAHYLQLALKVQPQKCLLKGPQ
jgi:hypothetical protein